jgi:hypothetical protein
LTIRHLTRRHHKFAVIAANDVTANYDGSTSPAGTMTLRPLRVEAQCARPSRPPAISKTPP